MSAPLKYKFVEKPEKIPITNNQLCQKKHCKNIHLWINKVVDSDAYSFALDLPSVWKYANYCDSPKHICIKKSGIIMEFLYLLQAPPKPLERSVYVSKECMALIFGEFGYKQNWQIYVF